jgi:fumarate reductase subunit C
VSTYWWAQRPSYLAFILRELSSIFVAWFVVFLLLLVHAMADGAAGYQRFLDWADTPWVVVLNLVALAFVVFHAVTWFYLSPKAMVIRLRGRRVPGSWIVASQYAAWAVVSAIVLWVLVAI